MDSEREFPSLIPTAAVGSQPQDNSRPLAETTFAVKQVMGLVTSITKTVVPTMATLFGNAAPMLQHLEFYPLPVSPHERSHDIKDWCANVNENITKLKILPHGARIKAILQLWGWAKTWAETWSLHSTTWERIKEELIQTFGWSSGTPTTCWSGADTHRTKRTATLNI